MNTCGGFESSGCKGSVVQRVTTGHGRCRQGLDICFKGLIINRSMLQAAVAVHAKLDDASRQAIYNIEKRHGPEVISGGYVKIFGVIRVCEKWAAENFVPLPRSLQFIFEGMLFDLDRKRRAPEYFTHNNLQSGWILTTLGKLYPAAHAGPGC